MITIPSILDHKNITVFPDDEDPNQFYALKNKPEITVEEETPVFSGLFWTDQADGSSTSVAGLDGGWINFDVNLAISEDELEEIKAKLNQMDIQNIRRKELIKQERERLSLIAKARGDTFAGDPDVPAKGEIRFGNVNFLEGHVELLEEKEGEMVPWSSTGGPASLIGDNNAAFALRLSPKGAAVWYKSLKDDAKAFSIRYKLKFQMRLPSLEIRAWAGSSQSFEMERKVDRVWRNVDKGCSDADVERINEREVRQSLLEEGLMNIEINKGSTQISDEHVSQLRNLAMKLIDEKIKEILKSRIRGMTVEERQNSMIEVITEEVNSFVELRFSQRDVVAWEIAPQGTIMEFLSDIPDEKKARITKLVDLSETEAGTVEIPVFVSAPWAEEPNVTAVKVNCEYPAAEETYSKVFKQNDTTDTWWFRQPKKDDGVVYYYYEVFFKGISDPLVKEKQTTNAAINIQVGNEGVIDLKFKPHPNLSSLSGDYKINSTQIDIKYKESDEPGHFVSSVIVPAESPDGVPFKRMIGKTIDSPLYFDMKYFTKGGETIDMPTTKYWLSGTQTEEIYTPNPFEDTLKVDVDLAITPDKSLKKIITEFVYTDEENNFESSDRVVLDSEVDWLSVTAKLVQLNSDHKNFRYRYKIIGDNYIGSSDWIESSGDQTIFLPILQVLIDISHLKIGEKYSTAILDLLYENGDEKESHQFFLDDLEKSKRVTWFVPRTSTTHDEYSYNLTLVDEEGNMQEFKDMKGSGKFLIVQDPNN